MLCTVYAAASVTVMPVCWRHTIASLDHTVADLPNTEDVDRYITMTVIVESDSQKDLFDTGLSKAECMSMDLLQLISGAERLFKVEVGQPDYKGDEDRLQSKWTGVCT